MYVFTQPFYYGQDVTQGQFLSRLKLVWMQSFPFALLVALTKAKEPSLPSYLLIAEGERIESCLFQPNPTKTAPTPL